MGVYVSNESGQLKKYSGMRRQTEDPTKANITGDNIINRAFLGNLANGCLDQRQKEDTYGRPVSGDDCTSALEIYNLVLANPNTRPRSLSMPLIALCLEAASSNSLARRATTILITMNNATPTRIVAIK